MFFRMMLCIVDNDRLQADLPLLDRQAATIRPFADLYRPSQASVDFRGQ